MAQDSIALTASMRSNLSSLKMIQKQMDVTQERLSTGKKVNSAIDNASSFYQARSLTNRASDLDALLDSMGQGIQTIQAANEGIEAVTSFVEQLKSIANSAFALDPSLGQSYDDAITSYKNQYDEILTEIDKLVKDSSYQGVNLLTGGKLTVTFNETRSNRFDIHGDDIVKEMAINKAETWALDYPQVDKVSDTNINAKVNITDGTEVTSYTDGATPPTTTKAVKYDGKWYDTTTKTAITDTAIIAGLDASTTTENLADAIDITVGTVNAGAQVYSIQNADGEEQAQAVKVGNDYYNATGGAKIDMTGMTAIKATEADTTGTQSYAAAIDTSLDELSKAIDYLRSYATELGNNYAIIETRQNFTDALIDVLET